MTGRRRAGALALWLAAGGAVCAQDTPLRGGAPDPALGAIPGSAGPSATLPASLPATLPDSLADAVGTWDLSLDGSGRRCTLTLSGDSGPNGRALRFPAGCRRALPVLAHAAGWLYADRGIRIVDVNIRPLVAFVPQADARSLHGRSEAGQGYSLVPLQTVAMLPPQEAGEAAAPSPALAPSFAPAPSSGPPPGEAHAIPGSQPVLPSGLIERGRATEPAAARPEDATGGRAEPAAPPPGTYALDRFEGRDVCRLALDPRPAGGREGARDLAPARILPGCHDGGIATFDPVAWRFASGHLTLKARRGHAVNLVATGDGRWRRDPDVGTTFVLRRVD